jgi:thiamine biosynthesis lipoprotein ApbE
MSAAWRLTLRRPHGRARRVVVTDEMVEVGDDVRIRGEDDKQTWRVVRKEPSKIIATIPWPPKGSK